MPRILVTNDDGVHAPGVKALAAVLEPLGEVIIVAPLGESSAIGHAITLTRPLRLDRIDARTYGVDGTPTDCVVLAVDRVLRGLPDLVVSGINPGYNLGDDVTYSGTVSGALEGALLGVPGIAVSLARSRDYHFGQAAWAARTVAEAVLRQGLPARTFLNVNVPKVPAKGFRVTTQGSRTQTTAVAEGEDPRGRNYYWIEEVVSEWTEDPGSDIAAVRDGWISVTPLQPDMTAHSARVTVEALGLPDGGRTAAGPAEAGRGRD
jgi:5'-nucleotidase